MTILQLAALQLLLLTVPTATARTISWSGYTWDVRADGFGGPGPNQWSDSGANVAVDGSALVLSVVKDASGRWTSAEVDNQTHLGYGTYRWVVATDLSDLDSNEVLGMFTYGGPSPSNNEIDIEPSHWGNLAWPTGSVTVWQDAAAGRNQSATFDYTNRPPYVNQFTWEPGRIRYLVTDATGATVFSRTVTSGVPVPSSEVPMINYWRFENAPPAGARSMRISSFTWVPLGGELAAPGPDGAGASPATDVGAALGRPTCGTAKPSARVRMRPRRFAVTGRRRGATIRWNVTGEAKLRLVIKRRVRDAGLVTVGAVKRSLSSGNGRMRFTGEAGGRRLRPGSYRLAGTLTAGAKRVRCAPKALRFTVVGS